VLRNGQWRAHTRSYPTRDTRACVISRRDFFSKRVKMCKVVEETRWPKAEAASLEGFIAAWRRLPLFRTFSADLTPTSHQIASSVVSTNESYRAISEKSAPMANLPYLQPRDDPEAALRRFEFQPRQTIRWQHSTMPHQHQQARS
jgi:hypothetical protein